MVRVRVGVGVRVRVRVGRAVAAPARRVRGWRLLGLGLGLGLTRARGWRLFGEQCRCGRPASQNTSASWPRLAEAGGRPALDLRLAGVCWRANWPKPPGAVSLPNPNPNPGAKLT
eukprot:scaffold72854_cov36-Phaeocystis_antarctica.AAC.1